MIVFIQLNDRKLSDLGSSTLRVTRKFSNAESLWKSYQRAAHLIMKKTMEPILQKIFRQRYVTRT